MKGESGPRKPQGLGGEVLAQSALEDPAFQGEETEDFDSILSELGANASDVSIIVSKFNDQSNARHGYDMCGKYAAEGFDPFDLPKEFGAGRFRIQFKRGNKYIRSVVRSFLVPARRNPEPEDGGASRELRESRAFERQMLLTLMTGLVGRPAGLAAGPAPAPGMTVADMVSLFNAGREASAAASTPIDAIREAFTLGRELAGGGASGDDEGDGMQRRGGGSMFERLAPRALDMIERVLPSMVAPKPPAPVVATANAPAAPQQPENPAASLVRRYAPQILAEARAGRDPHAWGAFVAERVPEAVEPYLLQFAEATKEQRQEFLAQVAPELLAYQSWIDDACAGILEIFQPDEAGETAGATAGADDAP